MPKISIPDHPSHPLHCGDCKFWHAKLVKEFVLVPPQGQMIVKADAIKNGMPIGQYLTSNSAPCFYNPKWEMKDEDDYCSHFEARKVY